MLHIDTYIHIYIYHLYRGLVGLPLPIHNMYIYIHAYTYIERFKVLRFDTVAKNGNADGVIE